MPTYSLNTHTPDQPIDRPRLLHWFVDLTAPRTDSLPKAEMIFMTFRELSPNAFR
jgi:hypothetical protein